MVGVAHPIPWSPSQPGGGRGGRGAEGGAAKLPPVGSLLTEGSSEQAGSERKASGNVAQQRCWGRKRSALEAVGVAHPVTASSLRTHNLLRKAAGCMRSKLRAIYKV